MVLTQLQYTHGEEVGVCVCEGEGPAGAFLES